MNANFKFFDNEQDRIMELLLFAEDLFDLKRVKPPKRDATSGKLHLYLETVDHKQRTRENHNS